MQILLLETEFALQQLELVDLLKGELIFSEMLHRVTTPEHFYLAFVLVAIQFVECF